MLRHCLAFLCVAPLLLAQPLVRIEFPHDGEEEVPLLVPVVLTTRYPVLETLLVTRAPLPDSLQGTSVLPSVVLLPEPLADTAFRPLWGRIALAGTLRRISDTVLHFTPDTGALEYGRRYAVWVLGVAMVRDSAGQRDTLRVSAGPVRFTTVRPPHHVVWTSLTARSSTLWCTDTVCLQLNRPFPAALADSLVQLLRLQGISSTELPRSLYRAWRSAEDSSRLCVAFSGLPPGGYALLVQLQRLTGDTSSWSLFPFVIPERAFFRLRVTRADGGDTLVLQSRLAPVLPPGKRLGRALGQELRLEAPAFADTFCFRRWLLVSEDIAVVVDTPLLRLRIDSCPQLREWELIAEYALVDKDTVRLEPGCLIGQDERVYYDRVDVYGYADSLDMFTYTVWKLPWAHLRIAAWVSDTSRGYYRTVLWRGNAPGYGEVPGRWLQYYPAADCQPGRLWHFFPCFDLLQSCPPPFTVCVRYIQEPPAELPGLSSSFLPPFDTCGVIEWSSPLGCPVFQNRCRTSYYVGLGDTVIVAAYAYPCTILDTVPRPTDCWEFVAWEESSRSGRIRHILSPPLCGFRDTTRVKDCEMEILFHVRPHLDTLWVELRAEDWSTIRDAYEQKFLGVELTPEPLVDIPLVQVSDSLIRLGYLYRCGDTVRVAPIALSGSGLAVGYWNIYVGRWKRIEPPPDSTVWVLVTPGGDTVQHIFCSNFRLVEVELLRPDGSFERIPSDEFASSYEPTLGMVALGGHSRTTPLHDRTTQILFRFNVPVDSSSLRQGLLLRDAYPDSVVFRISGRRYSFRLTRPQDGEFTTVYNCRFGPEGNVTLTEGGKAVIVKLVDSTGLFAAHYLPIQISLREELRSRSGQKLANPRTVYRRTQLPSFELRLDELRLYGCWEGWLMGDQEVVLFHTFAAGQDSLRSTRAEAVRLPSNDAAYDMPCGGSSVSIGRILAVESHLSERQLFAVGWDAWEEDDDWLKSLAQAVENELVRVLTAVLNRFVLDSLLRSIDLGPLLARTIANLLQQTTQENDHICTGSEVFRAENWWHGRLAYENPAKGFELYWWDPAGSRGYFYARHRIAVSPYPFPPGFPAARVYYSVLLR
ncbi:hypothetical protein HRbin21_01008 [bacterium HR21]|nr:hypothetical protein HRbin21_01008 [bacterium HR21]